MYRKELLHILKNRPTRRKNLTHFINKLTSRQIMAIEHVIRLFLRGKLKLPKTHMNKLRRHKVKLRRLIYHRPKTLKLRKKIISQTGGNFLFSLIPSAIAAISSLFK